MVLHAQSPVEHGPAAYSKQTAMMPHAQIAVAFIVEHGDWDDDEAHHSYADIARKPKRLCRYGKRARGVWYVGCAGVAIRDIKGEQ